GVLHPSWPPRPDAPQCLREGRRRVPGLGSPSRRFPVSRSGAVVLCRYLQGHLASIMECEHRDRRIPPLRAAVLTMSCYIDGGRTEDRRNMAGGGHQSPAGGFGGGPYPRVGFGGGGGWGVHLGPPRGRRREAEAPGA